MRTSGLTALLADLGLGMDELLSKHFAHLFIRDPLVIFSETVDQDDSVMSDHFEVGISIYNEHLMTVDRIYNLQIGKPCGSSLHHQALPWDGE